MIDLKQQLTPIEKINQELFDKLHQMKKDFQQFTNHINKLYDDG